MFERIKNIFSGIGFIFQYGSVVRTVTDAYATFPGIDDSDLLRLWLRPLLTDTSSLASLTQTKIDDMIVSAAVKIVDNNHAWTAIHAMALLLHGGTNGESVRIPSSSDDLFSLTKNIAEETMPECPSAVLSAIGIILFLLQRRSNKS